MAQLFLIALKVFGSFTFVKFVEGFFGASLGPEPVMALQTNAPDARFAAHTFCSSRVQGCGSGVYGSGVGV